MRAIDRYGAVSVFGRTMTGSEIARIAAAENVMAWVGERARAENWVTWNQSNRRKAEALDIAAKLTRDIYGE